MPERPAIRCVHCGVPLDPDDRICFECGMEQPAGPGERQNRGYDAVPTAVITNLVPEASPDIVSGTNSTARSHPLGASTCRAGAGSGEFSPPEFPILSPPETSAVRGRASGSDATIPASTRTPPLHPEPTSPGDCRDLRVYVNISRVFVEGMEMPFQFRVIPRVPGITKLAIEIWRSDRCVAREQPAWELQSQRELDIPIAYRPCVGSHGKATFEIRLSYELEGKRHTYSRKLLFNVYRRSDTGKKVFDNLVLDIKNQVDVRHAGEAKINNALGELLETVRGRAADPISEFNLYDLAEVWVPMEFYRIEHPSALRALGALPPPADAKRSCISLLLDGFPIHVLSLECIQIGRSGDCDIVARRRAAPGAAVDASSLRISRYHCQIELRETECRLLDWAWNPKTKTYSASTNGVYLNGNRVPPGKDGQPIEPGVLHTISLGSKRDCPTCFQFKAKLWRISDLPQEECEAWMGPEDRPAALALWPHSTENPSVYLLLWAFLPLAVLRPEWYGFCLCRAEEAFRLRMGKACDWIMPGFQRSWSRHTVKGEAYSARAAAGLEEKVDRLSDGAS